MGSTGTESAAGASASHERRNVSDVTGVLLLGACAAWSLITAAARGGRPEGVLLAVLAVAAGYAAGRICGAVLPVVAPSAGALAGLGLAVTDPHTMTGSPLVSPLGHTGATAALLVLSAGAACCAAWAARAPGPRLALRLLACGIAVTAAALGSITGFAACAGVLLCSLAAARMRRGPGLVGLALATGLVTTTVWAVAENALPAGLTDSLEGQLTPHRILLWHDALGLVHDEPLLGAGPGRFGELSPTVAESLSADDRPHSAPLQLAAEQGLAGVALLAAVFGWVLYVLWRTPRSTPVVLTAGAALTAMAAIAAVGNALSFTTVTAGAGLLAGMATAWPLTDGESETAPDLGDG
ncbi:O-antigen ligase [Streptomyces sp. cf124]|nr:O-antigen ligase family protein [Streptomyces caniscabiei]SFN33564.1 O-antigen ligase [Streptomyces sp. cf124]MBE4741064.1 O-antigen ligase family protein [Streptomyces caniscabiei]MBE4760413.1 O-antigen ligase family protein [Streptomyces caniscabiei]MBE4774421.1 O-antigen ligase family protein [Streptomyces caniscabiei]MBE4789356.1 O-antigen ligase family protein [Streptomyces caniscabiei]